MANVPLKSITFPGLTDTYTVPQIDTGLNTAGKAADAKKTGDEISNLKSALYPTAANITSNISVSNNYLNGSGVKTYSNTTDLYVSDYIPVFKGDIVTLANVRAGSSHLILAFYTDQNESTFVAPSESPNPYLGAGASKDKSAVFTATQDGYIRLGCRHDLISSAGTAVVYINVLGNIDGRIDALENLTKYVASNGSDSNDGTSASPYATVGKALSAGATVINVKAGDYTELISAEHLAYPVKIYGYGAKFSYSMTEKVAGKIVFDFRSCKNVEIYGVSVEFTGTAGTNPENDKPYKFSGFLLSNSTGKLVDCSVSGASDMGFRLDGSKSTLIRCKAAGCYDGFNAHDTGTSIDNGVLVSSGISEGTFIDCEAISCTDDGLSYHENGIIHVHGGKFVGNTSTGIAPHHNCSCEIIGAYIANNGFTGGTANGHAGLEALYGALSTGESYHDPLPTMVLIGCVFENNGGNAVTAEHYIVKACANGASGNGTNSIVDGGSASITTFTLMS